MVKANSSVDEKIETLVQLRCLEGWTNGIHGELTSISALNIFLAVTAFLGNTLILVSLRKESSLRPPSKLLLRCLAATDLCVGVIAQPFQVIYWLSLVYKDWNLCPYALNTTFITGYTLTSVSMLTLTAISVDRLLALILGLRYKQVVTLTRTYAVVITFWFISTLAGTLYLKDYRITLWYGYIALPSCLVITIFSNAKIVHSLFHNQNQIHIIPRQQQQLNQSAPLNLCRYRKAVYGTLWLQLALVICYVPYSVMGVWMNGKVSPANFVILVSSVTCVYLNSAINPFLYWWKISSVRQAVKETIKQFLCCLST